MAKAKPKKSRAVRKKRKRDYKKEYARRIARAKALGYSKSVARGHPKRDVGEVGRAELRQMRGAARALSPGEQRRAGSKKPKSSALRIRTRERVAEIAGVNLPLKGDTQRTQDGEAFVKTFVRLGLGSKQAAWTLWFSP